VVHLVVLVGVLRATTKKVVNFFEKKVHPRENPGYAYVFKCSCNLLFLLQFCLFVIFTALHSILGGLVARKVSVRPSVRPSVCLFVCPSNA